MTDRKGRLLVVDDDRAIRKLLERIAQRVGFTVDTARDGVEALQMLDAADYDVAIVDLMMPRLSGYELVARLGVRERRPVVLVATALTNGDAAKVDDSMVRRVIRKPFDVQALVAALSEALADALAKADVSTAAPAAPAEEPEAGKGETPGDIITQHPC